MTAFIERGCLKRRSGRVRRSDLLSGGLVALFCYFHRIAAGDPEDTTMTKAPLPSAGSTKQHRHYPSTRYPSGVPSAWGGTAATARGMAELISQGRHYQKVREKTTTIGNKKEGGIRVTEENLPKMKNVAVLQREGIIYCPIAKVASTEWKRSLRWMVGIEDWVGDHTNVNSAGKNGLERLRNWGLKGVQWALESDRYFRFVVVRDPAERLVSAFLNKCVTDGYMSGRLSREGAPSCAYLTFMPELFPNVTEATLVTHKRLRDLVERKPEDTFMHFVSGIWAEMEHKGDACLVSNHHFRPQMCFCDLEEILPAFHVFRFSNISAEAAAFADRIPGPTLLPHVPDEETLDSVGVGGSGEFVVGRDGPGGTSQAGRRNGISVARREEIDAFLKERFEKSRDTDVKITGAAHRKSLFLSQRVIEIVHKMFKKDYERLGHYFPAEESHGGNGDGDGSDEAL